MLRLSIRARDGTDYYPALTALSNAVDNALRRAIIAVFLPESEEETR